MVCTQCIQWRIPPCVPSGSTYNLAREAWPGFQPQFTPSPSTMYKLNPTHSLLVHTCCHPPVWNASHAHLANSFETGARPLFSQEAVSDLPKQLKHDFLVSLYVPVILPPGRHHHDLYCFLPLVHSWTPEHIMDSGRRPLLNMHSASDTSKALHNIPHALEVNRARVIYTLPACQNWLQAWSGTETAVRGIRELGKAETGRWVGTNVSLAFTTYCFIWSVHMMCSFGRTSYIQAMAVSHNSWWKYSFKNSMGLAHNGWEINIVACLVVMIQKWAVSVESHSWEFASSILPPSSSCAKMAHFGLQVSNEDSQACIRTPPHQEILTYRASEWNDWCSTTSYNLLCKTKCLASRSKSPLGLIQVTFDSSKYIPLYNFM